MHTVIQQILKSRRDKLPRAVTSLYLTIASYKALQEAAKSQGIAASEVVDFLIRKAVEHSNKKKV